MGFQSKNTIASDLVFLIPDADLYSFGVLMSNVHNAWIRLVAGRLKSDYRYSKDIVYNNHHADRFALGTNRDEREQTNGRLSCKIRFEEEVYYNAR